MAAVDAIGVIPKATNWSKDPNGTRTAWWLGTGGAISVDSSRAYTGTSSIKWTASGAVAANAAIHTTPLYNGVAPNDAIPVVAGDLVSVAERVSTDLAAKSVYLRLRFYTAAGVEVTTGGPWQTSPVVLPASTDFTYLDIHDVEVPATAVFMVAGIYAGTSFVSTDAIYFDGQDIRKNGPLVHFVAGNQGTLYGWNGTPDASTSYRLESEPQGMTGWGGMTSVSTSVFVSDALGNDYDELTEYVIGGDISFDIDRDVKSLVKLQVSDVTKFAPYSWVKVYRTVKTELTDAITYPVGLFRLGMPSAYWLVGDGELSGQDATAQLADTVTTDTLNLAAGKAYTTCIAELLVAAGFAGRFDIPTDATAIPTGGLTFPTGTSYLEIVNKLLSAIGFYNLYTLPDGRFASQEYINRLEVTPAHTYIIGQTADLLDEIYEQPSDANLYNYVVVTRQGTSTNYIGIAENKRASHPYSTVSLGKLAGLPKVYRTKRVALNEAAGQSIVNRKAREVLELSSMLRYVTVSIMPGPNHLPHEVVELEADGTNAEHLSGRYYAESYSFGLAGSDATMKYRMRRVEATDD